MARSTLSDLILKVRTMISDPAGSNQHFLDDDIAEYLDEGRDDVRYEGLTIAPSIVNNANTSNTPQTVFANFYSKYKFWETDAVLQGQLDGSAWKVLTPVAADYFVGLFQFEVNEFASGTVPGQLPPVFITGKIFDPFDAAASLLEIWGASLACAYDVTVDGQSLRRSQLMTAKLALAEVYRKKAKPKLSKMVREDVRAPISSKKIRLLDDEDVYRGF